MLREYTMDDLQKLLQAVRGEKAVKTQEVSIRQEYIQAAVDEVFSENDFYFNRRVTGVDDLLVYDEDEGAYPLPDNFSISNDFYARDIVTNRLYRKSDGQLDLRFSDDGEYLLFVPGATNALELVYYIAAPDLIEDATEVVRFPQGYLLAERAYVRLKTAYMPDEDTQKEYQRSRQQCRLLANRSVPSQNYVPGRR